MKRLITFAVLYLLSFTNIYSQDLDQELQDFSKRMNAMACAIEKPASLINGQAPVHCEQSGSKTVRPGDRSNGAGNWQSADGWFVRMLKRIRRDLFGPTVRRMAFNPQNCPELMQRDLSFKIPSDEECEIDLMYDLLATEGDSYPLTKLHQCQEFVCERFGIDNVKKIIQQKRIKNILDPEKFFGCTESILI